MRKIVIDRLLITMMLTSLLCMHMNFYAAIAYMPQGLRDCINRVYEMAQQTNIAHHNLAEIHAMIAENRIFSSENIMRKGLQEAFNVLKNGQKNAQAKVHAESMIKYLQGYARELDNVSTLFALRGAVGQEKSWPISLIANSLSDVPGDVDMMCASSMLASVDNIQLCGNLAQQTRLFDHNLSFNASMMTNVLYNFPNVIFGTGVTSPIINAWSMSPSYMIQSPINMQLAVPSALFIERAEMIDLHFLSSQQGFDNGKARVAINVKYMGQYGEFNIFDSSPLFTYVVESKDFKIFEPMDSNNIRHVCVTVPLEKTLINKCNLIILSLIRVEPHVNEYNGDIYLAAAVLRYTQL